MDVYGFARVLYEMVYGSSLETSSKDSFLDCPYSDVKAILESILTPSAIKNGLPRIKDLLALP